MQHTHWFKALLPVASIFGIRMLGLFMLIPVLTLYAPTLQHATPETIGVALGIYGLTQALLQIPFGYLSDRWGRKPLLIVGLLFFTLGSVIGALSHSIMMLIIARLLQGAGAIGSVLIALLADRTQEADRAKSMACLGVLIGLTFLLAIIIAPTLTHAWGLSGLFYSMTGLGLIGILLVMVSIPGHMAAKTPAITLKPAVLKTLITDPTLCRLNLAILIQHAILTALFYIIPTTLADFIHQAHLGKTWHFYLPVMLLSFILMLPALRAAEKQQQIYTLLRTMILLLAASQLLLAWYITSWVPFCILMLLYFIAFNTLEAALPAQISREAPSHLKGTAMGIYSSAQFSGLFLGGALAGYIDTHYGHTGILTLNGLLACGWYILLRTHHSGSSR